MISSIPDVVFHVVVILLLAIAVADVVIIVFAAAFVVVFVIVIVAVVTLDAAYVPIISKRDSFSVLNCFINLDYAIYQRRDIFWAVALKGTKSCRTQGDFLSSVRLFVC